MCNMTNNQASSKATIGAQPAAPSLGEDMTIAKAMLAITEESLSLAIKTLAALAIERPGGWPRLEDEEHARLFEALDYLMKAQRKLKE